MWADHGGQGPHKSRTLVLRGFTMSSSTQQSAQVQDKVAGLKVAVTSAPKVSLKSVGRIAPAPTGSVHKSKTVPPDVVVAALALTALLKSSDGTKRLMCVASYKVAQLLLCAKAHEHTAQVRQLASFVLLLTGSGHCASKDDALKHDLHPEKGMRAYFPGNVADLDWFKRHALSVRLPSCIENLEKVCKHFFSGTGAAIAKSARMGCVVYGDFLRGAVHPKPAIPSKS